MKKYLPLFFLAAVFFLHSCKTTVNQQNNPVPEPVKSFLLDADTGNEMDDLYAIFRCLADPEIELTAISSAHFNNVQLLTDSIWHIYPTDNINTVKISQDLNVQMLKDMNASSIPHPVGCDRMVGYSWGYYEGAPIPDSEATQFIIHQALEHDSIQKLNIVCLGAVTNVASAVLLRPEIASNIRLFALTMRLDGKERYWNKNTFNARNDTNGLEVLLENPELEFWVIPGNVSRQLTFQREESMKKLAQWDHPAITTLENRWDEVNAGESWIMWDLALIEAMINPQWADFETLSAPPENGARDIQVITGIDEDQIRANFWRVLENYMKSGI